MFDFFFLPFNVSLKRSSCKYPTPINKNKDQTNKILNRKHGAKNLRALVTVIDKTFTLTLYEKFSSSISKEKLCVFNLRKRLFTGTVSVNKAYFTGTVPVNNAYVTGSVHLNNLYLTGTIPVNKAYLTRTMPVNKAYLTGRVPANKM